MKSHWELFQAANNHAPKAVQEFVDANIVTNFIAQVAVKEKIELASDTQRDLLYAINLTLLSGKSLDDLKSYTEKVDWGNPQYKKLYELGVMLYVGSDDYETYGSKSITTKTRESARNNVNDTQAYLLDNIQSKIARNGIAIRHDLLEVTLYKKFVITVEDVILGFYDEDDVEPLLRQELGIDAEAAKPLAADVREFLAPLHDPDWQPPNEAEEISTEPNTSISVPTPDLPPPAETAGTTDRPIVPHPEASLTPTTEPNTTPQPTESIADDTTPGLRTMAHDMEDSRKPKNDFTPIADDDEPTHRSSQADLQTNPEDAAASR